MGFQFKGAGSSPKPSVKFSGGQPPQQTKPTVQMPSWLTSWWNQQQNKPQQPAQIGNLNASNYTQPKPPQSPMVSPVGGASPGEYLQNANQQRANQAYADRYQAMADAYFKQQRNSPAAQAFHWGGEHQFNPVNQHGWGDNPYYQAKNVNGQTYNKYWNDYSDALIKQGQIRQGINTSAPYMDLRASNMEPGRWGVGDLRVFPEAPSGGGSGGGGYSGGGGGYGPAIGTPDLPSWYLNMLVWNY